MKILLVTPRYFPYIGGTETHVHEVGRRLVEYGVSVTLLTVMPPDAGLPREEIQHGMRIIRVKALSSRNDYFFAPEIYTIVARGGWDLVHCQGCHTFVPILAMLAARKAKIPYIVTFHTGGHSSQLRHRLRSAQWRTLRPLLAGSAKLIGVSRFEADHFCKLLHIPAQHFAVIPNGLNQLSLDSLANIKKLYNNNSNVNGSGNTNDSSSNNREITETHLIISPGRLERYKGHQHMIQALPLIREQYPAARLVILGTGPYEASLRKLAQRMGVAAHVEIRMIPPGNRHEMIELLARASLISLLSEYEAHPVSIVEALAVKRPVLVTHTSGMQELAEQGLVRSVPLHSSPQTIAAAALEQIANPLIPAHVSLPTWDDSAHELYETYRHIINTVSSSGAKE